MLAKQTPMTLQDDVATLRAEFKALGYQERPTVPLVASWLVHFTIGMGGLALFVVYPTTWMRVASMLVACFGFIGLATLGHTASHHAASDNKIFNKLYLYVTYPLLLQLSANFWHYTHVQVHHTAPNIDGIDNDCDLRPFFALNANQQKNGSAFKRWYWKYQGYLFPFMLPMNAFNVQRKGWRHLYRELKNPKQRNASTYLDLFCMTAHFGVWLVIPMMFLSPWLVLEIYVLRTAIVGTGLFGILAPGHFPAEAVVMERSQREEGDFYLRQAVSTVNFDTGVVGRFLCSGLEYQLEHHFFPGISHIYYPKMAPMVRAFCERQGLPYRSLPWLEAIWKSYMVFFHVKPVIKDVDQLRGAMSSRYAA